jgi:hypothetical protein
MTSPATPAKIKDRISAALRANGGTMKYHALMTAVFPRESYPRAYERPTRGGPPGCSMALSRAIREHGFSLRFDDELPNVVYATVGLGVNK